MNFENMDEIYGTPQNSQCITIQNTEQFCSV